MSLPAFPDEIILEIFQQLDSMSLGKIVRTSFLNWNIGQQVYINKLIEYLLGYKLSQSEIKDHLDDPILLLEHIRDFEYDLGYDLEQADKILKVIIGDPRTKVTPKFFAEALKINLYRTIEKILKIGKIDPNDQEIFENTKLYDEDIIFGHNLIESIVDDPRTTAESRRKYEQMFLSSSSRMDLSSANQSQFREFDAYKYKFVPEDVRQISHDLSLSDIKEEIGFLYLSNWRNLYLKTFDKPTVQDFVTFIWLSPPVGQAQKFLNRMSGEPNERKEIASRIDTSEGWIYDPINNTIDYDESLKELEEEEFEED